MYTYKDLVEAQNNQDIEKLDGMLAAIVELSINQRVKMLPWIVKNNHILIFERLIKISNVIDFLNSVFSNVQIVCYDTGNVDKGSLLLNAAQLEGLVLLDRLFSFKFIRDVKDIGFLRDIPDLALKLLLERSEAEVLKGDEKARIWVFLTASILGDITRVDPYLSSPKFIEKHLFYLHTAIEYATVRGQLLIVQRLFEISDKSKNLSVLSAALYAAALLGNMPKLRHLVAIPDIFEDDEVTAIGLDTTTASITGAGASTTGISGACMSSAAVSGTEGSTTTSTVTFAFPTKRKATPEVVSDKKSEAEAENESSGSIKLRKFTPASSEGGGGRD